MEEKKYCFYKKDRLLHSLPIQGVLYLETSHNDVLFHTRESCHTVRMDFQSALDLLHGEPLVRIHRSFAVYLDAIETISSDTVIVRTMERKELPVSKKYFRELMNNIVILEPMKDCGCDVQDLDSEEKLRKWKMEEENGTGKEMNGEEYEDENEDADES
jgi:hypothetical protein